MLLKKHGIDLLLQGCNHGEELLLSGLGGQVLKGVFPVAVVVGETLVMAMVMVMMMVMFPCRRMSGLLCLYLWLTTD